MAYAKYRMVLPPEETPGTWVDLDPHFDSEQIFKLNVLNFKRYLSGKQKGLVMFYDSRKCKHKDLDKLFENVANASFSGKFGFGAVDCATDFPVCVRHSGCDTPMFKLYSNGYELSSIKDPTKISEDQIKMLMKMSPILFQPRGSIGRNFALTPSEPPVIEKPSSSGQGFFSSFKNKG